MNLHLHVFNIINSLKCVCVVYMVTTVSFLFNIFSQTRIKILGLKINSAIIHGYFSLISFHSLIPPTSFYFYLNHSLLPHRSFPTHFLLLTVSSTAISFNLFNLSPPFYQFHLFLIFIIDSLFRFQ